MDSTSIFYIAVSLFVGLILFVISQKKKPKEKGEFTVMKFEIKFNRSSTGYQVEARLNSIIAYLNFVIEPVE